MREGVDLQSSLSRTSTVSDMDVQPWKARKIPHCNNISLFYSAWLSKKCTYSSGTVVHALFSQSPLANSPRVVFLPFAFQTALVHLSVSLILPSFDTASVSMRRKDKLCISWISDAESIGVGERSVHGNWSVWGMGQ